MSLYQFSTGEILSGAIIARISPRFTITNKVALVAAPDVGDRPSLKLVKGREINAEWIVSTLANEAGEVEEILVGTIARTVGAQEEDFITSKTFTSLPVDLRQHVAAHIRQLFAYNTQIQKVQEAPSNDLMPNVNVHIVGLDEPASPSAEGTVQSVQELITLFKSRALILNSTLADANRLGSRIVTEPVVDEEGNPVTDDSGNQIKQPLVLYGLTELESYFKSHRIEVDTDLLSDLSSSLVMTTI